MILNLVCYQKFLDKLTLKNSKNCKFYYNVQYIKHIEKHFKNLLNLLKTLQIDRVMAY